MPLKRLIIPGQRDVRIFVARRRRGGDGWEVTVGVGGFKSRGIKFDEIRPRCAKVKALFPKRVPGN